MEDGRMPCVEDGTHSDDLQHQYEYEHHVGRHVADALPSVEQLARAVPERLPTGNPDVDRLRAAWNEGRAAILAALRDDTH